MCPRGALPLDAGPSSPPLQLVELLIPESPSVTLWPPLSQPEPVSLLRRTPVLLDQGPP